MARKPVGGLVGALLVGTLLLLVASLVIMSAPPDDDGGVSDQANYQEETDDDRRALIGGYLLARQTVTTDVGAYTDVTVHVCGPANPRCREQATEGDGSSADVGGRLEVSLRSAMPGDIRPLSSAVQPVTAATDMASWLWEVRPDKIGDFRLTVTVRILRGESDTALLPDRTIDITLRSKLTIGYMARLAWNGITSVAGLLTTLGITVSGVAVWLVRRRRAAAAPAETPDTPYL